MNRIIIPLLLLSFSLNGQSIASWQETSFAYKVKQVDEFIERFNHSPGTLARRQNATLTHRENLLSLFDHEQEHWDFSLIERFIKDMLRRPSQVKLSFYDPGWYAELKGTFLFHGAPKDITLILQNQSARNGGSKWVIVSTRENFILDTFDEAYCQDIPAARSKEHYLHPMSHASNFMEIEEALKDKENLQNFFDSRNQEMAFLAFKHHLLKGHLQYTGSIGITYHFLQVDKWIFTLRYFSRRGPNSGWLISTLAEASKEDKKRYRSEKLNLL